MFLMANFALYLYKWCCCAGGAGAAGRGCLWYLRRIDLMGTILTTPGRGRYGEGGGGGEGEGGAAAEGGGAFAILPRLLLWLR